MLKSMGMKLIPPIYCRLLSEGGENMKKYELLFLIDSSIDNQEIEETVAKFSDTIKNNGGNVTEVNNWGKRKTAYEVNKKWEGFYSLINFEAPAELIKELERVLRIDERVMKFLVIKVDEKKIAQADYYAQKRKEREAARSARFAAEAEEANKTQETAQEEVQE